MTFREQAAQKREELLNSLQQGKVRDPVTLIVMAAIAIGSALVSRMLMPNAPMQQVGLMKGTIQLQNSEQGTFIPEIYGAGPTVTLVNGTASVWGNLVNVTTGALGRIYKSGGADQNWNAGAAFSPAVTPATENVFIRFVVDDSPGTFSATAVGFCTSTAPESGTGVGGAPNLEFGVSVGINVTGTDQTEAPIIARVFHPVVQGVNGPALGTWYPSDEFRLEIRDGVYRLYHGMAEVTHFTAPTPSATVYIAVACWRTGYGLTTSYIQVNNIGVAPSAGSGGCKVPAMIVWAKNPEKHSYITTQTTQGGSLGGGSTTQSEQIYYTIDLRAHFARGGGGLQLLREYANTDILIQQDPNLDVPSGVYNPTAAEPPVYNPQQPPDALPADNLAVLRSDGDLDPDGDGGATGSVQQGASQIAVYDGTDTQGVDPTEEADVDLRNGIGSTTAHHGQAGTVHTSLNLQRWQNVPPNLTGVWQHRTLHTLDDIYTSLGQRPVDQNGAPLLDGSAFNFTSLSSIWCRGMLLDGRRFSPGEIFDNPDIQDFYNYFTTEGDGLILGFANGDEPEITIPEEDIGWLEAGEEIKDFFTAIEATKIDETRLVRRADLKYINPGSDWEPDTQSFERKVTLGSNQEFLQIQLTGNPDEARTAVARHVYREYVGEPVRFTLTWKYLHLFAGYKINVPTSAGITYAIRLKSIAGGIGLRNCEGVLLEPSSFDQSQVGGGPPVYNPAHPIPSLTILGALDLPAWRPGEAGKFGMYFAGAPRQTDTENWNGWALNIRREDKFTKLAEFASAGIVGRVVSVDGTLETDPAVTDTTSTITIDLYGSRATLESVTEANMIAGYNRAGIGQMIVGFASADRVAGFPNRWDLTTLRNGQYETDEFTADDQTGNVFVLFNDAVKFVELDITKDLNTEIPVKAVSLGAPLNDAAELLVACTGQSLKGSLPQDIQCVFDQPSDDALIIWAAQDETQTFELQFTDSGFTPIRPIIEVNPSINRDLEEAVTWDQDAYLPFTPPYDDFTLEAKGGAAMNFATELVSKASCEVVGGFIVKWRIPQSAWVGAGTPGWFPATSMGIVPETESEPSSAPFLWRAHAESGEPTYLYPSGFGGGAEPGSPDLRRIVIEGEEPAIVVRPDGVVEYHVNYKIGNTAWFISSKPVDTTVKWKAVVIGPGAVQTTMWTRQGPEFKYTAASQTVDYVTLPSTIYVQIRGKSLVDGGAPSAWVRKTFVRP